METGQPRELLGLLVLVAASFILLVYAFLRMAGIGRDSGRRGRPPPRTPLG